jgi:EPS-associated MarR family transcriptional regulator
VDRGLVKVENFRKSGNKLAYAYQLTPKGFSDKAKVTRRFLQLKQREYDVLKAEIAELRHEVSQSAQHDSAEPIES